MAAEKCLALLEQMAEPVTEKEEAVLRKIAETAITGKGAETSKQHLAEIAVSAVKKVADNVNGEWRFDKEHIKLETKVGGSVEQTQLIDGIIIEKEAVHPAMPKRIENAKVALLDAAIEIRDTEIDAKIEITDPSQMQTFLDQEEKMLRAMVDKIVQTGAKAVFCQKGIDDVAQHFLAKAGIYAARRVKKSDMEALSRATGGRIVSNLDDLETKNLGNAGLVEERKVGDDELTYITGCKNPRSMSILIRGGTEHIVAEARRAMTDAIGDVAASLRESKIVAGAGAPEMELSKELRRYSESLDGREQLAVLAFAESLEIIPRTLAENAGLDPIDVITELKAAHDKKQRWAGINVFTGKVIDAWKAGIIEPLKIKTQAISSAAEVAQMILRIDDVIAGQQAKQEKQMMPE
jgi:chaperonin GroEL (HSP60 family)